MGIISSITDFAVYTGKALTNTDWYNNFQQVLNIFNGQGTPKQYYDVNFATVTAHTGFVGDGSGLTGITTSSLSGIAFASGNTTWNFKQINIGAWNMDTDHQKLVAHGLSDAKIRSIDVQIVSDLGIWNNLQSFDTSLPTPPVLNGAINRTAGFVVMDILASGTFDSANYTAAANRGIISIWYEV